MKSEEAATKRASTDTDEANSFVLEEAAPPACLDEVNVTRARAWSDRVSLNTPGALIAWADAHDAHARHFVIRDSRRGGTAVAVARLCWHSQISDVPHASCFEPLPEHFRGPYCVWSRLAVVPEARGRGLAGWLERCCLAEAARTSGSVVGTVEERTPRHDLLETLGFQTLRSGFVMRPWGDAGPSIRFASIIAAADALGTRLAAKEKASRENL
jgi:GNAT superfamily N-acetyltransferase